ncbi:hypothetical protein M3Y98_01193300 [Aphelenchoides besseyi]|nr:hypothetical protein M3Y98_01193300 [Aphelenchoides besseyi]KAI6195073.1 hypothetical protein M3Y96_01192300 [Aphelenchoides besseyi]
MTAMASKTDDGPPEKRRRTAHLQKSPRVAANNRQTIGTTREIRTENASDSNVTPKGKLTTPKKAADNRRNRPTAGGAKDEKNAKAVASSNSQLVTEPPKRQGPRCTDYLSEKWQPEFQSTYPLSKALERRKVLVEYIQLVKRHRAQSDRVESPPKRNIVVQPQTVSELEKEIEKCDQELDMLEKKKEENANLRKDLTSRYKALYREGDEELKKQQEAVNVAQPSDTFMSVIQSGNTNSAASLPSDPAFPLSSGVSTTTTNETRVEPPPSTSVVSNPPPVSNVISQFPGLPASIASGIDINHYLQTLMGQQAINSDSPGPSGLQSSNALTAEALKQQQTAQHSIHSALQSGQLNASTSTNAAIAAAIAAQAMQKPFGISKVQRPSPAASIIQQQSSNPSSSGLLSQGTPGINLGATQNPFGSAAHGLLTQQSQGGLISQSPQAQHQQNQLRNIHQIPTSALNAAAAQNVYRELNQSSPNPQAAALAASQASQPSLQTLYAHQQAMQREQQKQQNRAQTSQQATANQLAQAQHFQEFLGHMALAQIPQSSGATMTNKQLTEITEAQQRVIATIMGLPQQAAAQQLQQHQQQQQNAAAQQAANMAVYQQMLAAQNPNLARQSILSQQMQHNQLQQNLLNAQFLQPTRQSPMQTASPTPARKPSSHSGTSTPQNQGQQRFHLAQQLHHSPHLQQQAGRSSTPQFAVPNLPQQSKIPMQRVQSTRSSSSAVNSVITSTPTQQQIPTMPMMMPPVESTQQQLAESLLSQLNANGMNLNSQALASNPNLHYLLLAAAQQQQQMGRK